MAYPKVTITENSMGDLHIWKGENQVNTSNPLNHKVSGKESDIYFQLQDDIDTAKTYLSKEEVEDLEKGYTIHTTKFPDDYFPEGE